MEHLREYQKDIVRQVNTLIEKGIDSVMVQAPTGGGKSVIMAELLREYLAQGKRILLIAHKIELIEQLYEHIHRWLDFKATILADKSYRYDPNCQVVIASIQSWSVRYTREGYKPPKADIIAIDEAHHSASQSYTNLFLHYPKAIKLGFTATPRRLDNKGLRYLAKGVEGYKYLVKGVAVAELMEEGFLSPYKLFGAGHQIDAEGKVKLTAGDYNQKDLAEFVATELSPSEVVNTWLHFAPYKKTVLYPVSVELSRCYVEEFSLRGIPSAHIDAKTPKKERKAILEDFRRGNILVLGQHSIIIEGVDVPDIEAVQFIRPTRSLVVWFQAIGRSLRPAPNKPHAIIIDHTTTHRQLPMPDFPVTWTLDPRTYLGGKQHLVCGHCGHRWIPSKDRELTHFELISIEYTDKAKLEHGIIKPCWCRKCNLQEPHQWTIELPLEQGNGQKESLEDKDLVIGQVDVYQPNQLVIEELKCLFDHAEAKGYSRAWVGYRAMNHPEVGYSELLWLADELGYKRSWASYRYEEKQHTIYK